MALTSTGTKRNLMSQGARQVAIHTVELRWRRRPGQGGGLMCLCIDSEYCDMVPVTRKSTTLESCCEGLSESGKASVSPS